MLRDQVKRPNSYSKTDLEVTFYADERGPYAERAVKKLAYNVQIAVENYYFIVHGYVSNDRRITIP